MLYKPEAIVGWRLTHAPDASASRCVPQPWWILRRVTRQHESSFLRVMVALGGAVVGLSSSTRASHVRRLGGTCVVSKPSFGRFQGCGVVDASDKLLCLNYCKAALVAIWFVRPRCFAFIFGSMRCGAFGRDCSVIGNLGG